MPVPVLAFRNFSLVERCFQLYFFTAALKLWWFYLMCFPPSGPAGVPVGAGASSARRAGEEQEEAGGRQQIHPRESGGDGEDEERHGRAPQKVTENKLSPKRLNSDRFWCAWASLVKSNDVTWQDFWYLKLISSIKSLMIDWYSKQIRNFLPRFATLTSYYR